MTTSRSMVPSVRAAVLATALVMMVGACSSGTTTASTGNGSGNDASSTTATGGSDGTDTTELKKVFKQDQTDIKIGTGETFAIRLPADPSIGESWDLVSQPDDSFVKADGSSFKAPAGAEPGAAGQIEYKFKAKKPGTTTVTFMQCERCGGNGSTVTTNPGGASAQRITFTITVG